MYAVQNEAGGKRPRVLAFVEPRRFPMWLAFPASEYSDYHRSAFFFVFPPHGDLLSRSVPDWRAM